MTLRQARFPGIYHPSANIAGKLQSQSTMPTRVNVAGEIVYNVRTPSFPPANQSIARSILASAKKAFTLVELHDGCTRTAAGTPRIADRPTRSWC